MTAASTILSALLPLATFVGPLGPRTGSSTGSASAEPPSAVGAGFTTENVQSMLRHRHALVMAGEDVTIALAVAESLAEVGASVVLGCADPERAQPAVDRINARTLAVRVEDGAQPEDGNGAPEWPAGCEVRPLELGSAEGVSPGAPGFPQRPSSSGRRRSRLADQQEGAEAEADN